MGTHDDHWVEWHRAYEDPTSPLRDRRRSVVAAISDALDSAPPGRLTVLSLCAGDATDLSEAAGSHPRRTDLLGVAVELDPELARRATVNLGRTGVDVEVRRADAGDTASFSDLLPVDVLLLAGIFGNVPDTDVERTIAAVPALCRPGAAVIWTRHRRPPDLTPQVRAWFRRAGCTHVRFEAPDDTWWSVGLERVGEPTAGRQVAGLLTRLFTFTDAG